MNATVRPLLLLAMLFVFVASEASIALAQDTPVLAWSLKYDPKTFDPDKVDDQASDLVRYLTGGVLLRLNRRTQQVEPWLAASWSVSADGKLVTFRLRDHLRFSDGSTLTSADVVASLKRLLAPDTQAPVAEEFLQPGAVVVSAPDPLTVKLQLPKRIVTIGKVFDEITIEPANRPSDARVTAGSFTVAEYKRGEYVRLQRNPNYWRHDAVGRQLPYLSTVRLDILANREQDELRFLRGDYQLIDTVPPESFSLLAKRAPDAIHDLGASLNTEQMWFNQSPAALFPAWEKAWFANRAFRMAVSQAIRRADLARIAYDGHATPANGFISPVNAAWYDRNLQPVHEDTKAALLLLQAEGFRKSGADLVDREGHPVRFSLLTNAGNRAREKMASLIQQDLRALGMQVNVVLLDFPALIERLMHTQDYEAALLGLPDVEPDPSAMMNIWLSSSPNHQWNPGEKTPATPWEAEIDALMNKQAMASSDADRKRAVDRVQEIVYEQQPFIYLVYPNALCAVSPRLSGVQFSVLHPSVVSDIDEMQWKAGK